MNSHRVETARARITDQRITPLPRPEPAAGEALLAIEGFALTANNVTYAASGEVIGYWKFFPTDREGYGIVPVWGFARVIESRAEGLKAGQRLYGFLPMAEHLLIRPKTGGTGSVHDTSAHRQSLPPIYNAYAPVGQADAGFDARRALFQPLLATSFLLFDFLQDNDWFGAEQIVVISASGKTGLGLCQYLSEARPDAPEVIGLTSGRNRDFVSGLGLCDRVASYDEIETLPARASVIVDMAGNAEIRARLHGHFGAELRHSAAVGTSHWDRFKSAGDLPGPRPQFFFAPARAESRMADWGTAELARRIDDAWQRVARDSQRWLTVEVSDGLTGAMRVYGDIARGAVAPDSGHFIRLTG